MLLMHWQTTLYSVQQLAVRMVCSDDFNGLCSVQQLPDEQGHSQHSWLEHDTVESVGTIHAPQTCNIPQRTNLIVSEDGVAVDLAHCAFYAIYCCLVVPSCAVNA
jgi:hypothetical protein